MDQKWLVEPISGLLLDITGVLKDGENPIEGSLDALRQLRNSGLPFRLVTNETQVSKSLLLNKLNKIGFEVTKDDIISPAPLLAKFLKAQNLRPHLLVHPNVLEDFNELSKSDPNSVVIGDAAQYFSYEAVNSTFQLLLKLKQQSSPVNFFSLGKGKYYKDNNELMLDVGAYTTGLEFATGITAQVFGKPSALYFEAALKDLSIPKSEVVMIGDDVEGDVGGAQSSGIRGILVKTGKYMNGDEVNRGVVPDGVVDNLKTAVELILKKCKS